ncbi:MAG TPA: TonB family protein [Flavisolibacter sp.]|jgi:protein TonB|nr:TonB family protein [Flavisolibacter sp.]
MTSHEIQKADLLDILFDNRNKQYGAYSLRKHYSSRLKFALGIAVSAVFLLLLLIRPAGKFSPADNLTVPPDLIITSVVMPKTEPKLPKLATPPAARKIASASLTAQLKIVDQVDEKKRMQDQNQMQHLAVAAVNTTGEIIPNIQTVPPPQPLTSEQGKAPAQPDEKFEPVERMPEFPGGRDAWLNFLNRYLTTPGDLEPGEKKVVQINFLVDADGTVTGFTVAQSAGKLFDNEVIRVLRKMPKWKPAVQNGHPIAVSFTQPVTFVGVEQ